MNIFLQLLINGLIAGSIYALIAAGFSLIYSSNKFIHFAHGAVVIAAGYMLYLFYNLSKINFCKSNCPMRTILSNSRPNIYNCMLSKKLLPKFLERAYTNDNYMNIVFGNDYKKEEVCD